MAQQDMIIFEPRTTEEADALKAFGTALKMKFKIAESGIFENNQELEIPEEHKAIVAERLDEYRKNPGTNQNFDELLRNIRKEYNL